MLLQRLGLPLRCAAACQLLSVRRGATTLAAAAPHAQAKSAPKVKLVTATKKQSKGLTPYQGPKRVFGIFRCSCGRKWQSANSWADCGKDCERCNTMVYPHKQQPLEKPAEGTSDLEKHHPEELCELCRQLGY